MTNVLNKKEIKQLNKLGEGIRISLNLNLTDLNNIGIPCRTDRLHAVKLMIKYLKVHDLAVVPIKSNNNKIKGNNARSNTNRN